MKTRPAIRGTSMVFAVLSALIITGHVLTISLSVAQREFGITGVRGLVEYNEVALVAVAFAGLAYAQRTGSHVQTDVVAKYLPERTRLVANVVGLLLAITVIGFLVYASGTRAIDAFAVREYRYGIAGVPIWPVRILIPVALSLLIAEISLSIVDLVKDARERESTTN